jgi:hypothetical protein
MDIGRLDALPVGRRRLHIIGESECLVADRAETRRQFPLGATRFVPHGKPVMVQLL